MPYPVVQLRDVDVRIDGQPVLRRINWRLAPGEHWAVLGGNGAGKSTFLRLLRGEVWPSPGRGERIYFVDGAAQRTAVGIKGRFALVSPEAHDRYLQLDWKQTVRDVVHTGFAGTDYPYVRPTREQLDAARGGIAMLDIQPLLARNVQELSSGELRKVLVARALVGRPQVLLLDEVCDGLDGPSRGKLLQALDRIAASGTQVVYTTHRPEELIPAITHALVLSDGKIIRQGFVRTAVARVSKRIGARAASSAVSNSVFEQGGEAARGPLIRIAGANVYLGRKRVLRDLDWRMREGENWAVFGANGAGKSTFLQLIAGDITAAAGSSVERFDLARHNTLWDLRKRIGYLSPRLQALYREPLTGAQVVASGFFASIGLRGKVTGAQSRRVSELFSRFDWGPLSRRDALQMSYGEFRKILLLRALVHQPKILICDEPFDGLDADAKAEFSAMLEQLSQNGTRLIAVTHHLQDVPTCMTHALLLENGAVACQGELADVRHHAAMKRLFDE